MMSEEDLERIEEAKTCDNCLCWHKHCKAECCKILFINEIDPAVLKEGGKYVIVKTKNLGLNMRWYYRLRDVHCVHGLLRYRKDRIIVVGRQMMYIHPCELLEGNLCKNHLGRKPLICKLLNKETAKMPGQPFEVTNNCLFRYK